MEKNREITQEQKEIIAREGRKQGQQPTGDIYQDTLNDRGQDVVDDIRTTETEEENRKEKGRSR